MILYHYTSLIWLAEIFESGGIRVGEVPVDRKTNYADVPKAVNLTTDPERRNQLDWAVPKLNVVDKTTIRLSVDVPDDQIVSFRQLRDKYKIRTADLKILAPYESRRHWFYVFGTVPTSQIVNVERWNGNRYEGVSDPQTLVGEIRQEFDRALVFETIQTGRLKGARAVHKKPGISETWLFDSKD